jgi:Tfp pilus assembly protein PilV
VKVRRSARGVSLIEALVAMAIMAFGMLGVVGMQATLRFNADISRQRAEAVRLAQEKLEILRNFSVLPTTTGSQAFADIVNETESSVSPPVASNASFSRQTTVASSLATDPDMRSVRVDVSWFDRRTSSGNAADAQTVTLSTVIAGIAPEIGGTFGIPGDQAPVQRPRGRHSSIPVGAVDQTGAGAGTSVFAPPGSSGVFWVFNNSTGQLASVCTAPPPIGPCSSTNASLLSGYVQFSLGDTPDSLAPFSLPPISGIGVSVDATAPTAAVVNCYVSTSPGPYLTYYCLMPIASGTWSGRSRVTGLPLALASTAPMPTDRTSTAHYRVCRYAPSATTTVNAEHPVDYSNVSGNLAGQNFLVITAGKTTGVENVCPTPTPTALLNAQTWPQDPVD